MVNVKSAIKSAILILFYTRRHIFNVIHLTSYTLTSFSMLTVIKDIADSIIVIKVKFAIKSVMKSAIDSAILLLFYFYFITNLITINKGYLLSRQ